MRRADLSYTLTNRKLRMDGNPTRIVAIYVSGCNRIVPLR